MLVYYCVFFLGPPFIRRMQRISTVAGRDIVVKCPYGGYPIDAISWTKGLVSLSNLYISLSFYSLSTTGVAY